MAEMLVSALLNVLLERLVSPQVVDFFRNKKLDDNLFTRLKISLMTISVVLDDAETKEFTHSGVKQWLEELKDVTYHAEDVLDAIVTWASKPKKSIFNKGKFDFGKKKLKRIESIVFKMELLASQKEALGLQGRVGDHTSMQGGGTTSLVDSSVYGRNDVKQKIVESVLMEVAVGDPIQVITIIGMGGIGKTTLAQIVYNDEKVDAYFDIKAWVCVTQELDVFHITKTILQTVTSNNFSDITNFNLLQLKLKEMLAGKKILLVLDDVWNEDYSKWCMLCAPFTSVLPGSKIIVTTRNHGVTSIISTGLSDHSLVPLSDDASWSLFTNHAFGKSRNNDDYQHLEVIGKQIVEKCKGLPLAIKLLGGVLRNKDEVKVWENVLKSEFWDLPIGKTTILPALRLSYHFLPTQLKPCFAYCSIFPQDYAFEKEKLVLLWMAEGFVIDNEDKSMEEIGEEYFNELFSRSFFQKFSWISGTYYFMHDLNNDLATYVSGKFCLNLERSKTFQISEKVRHFSYSQGKYDDHSKFGPILSTRYLRTFLSVGPYGHNLGLSVSIFPDFLLKLTCIRVLSLSFYRSINELPDSIGTLIHLRYLDLSHTSIQSLPDKICQLYNLQTLLLTNCRQLFKLPTNFVELVKLRHFDISGTSICTLPPKFRKLERLRTLSTFIVGEDNFCSGLGELKGFRHLKGTISILRMNNVKNVQEVIDTNMKEKVGIKEISLEWDRGTKSSNVHAIILDKLQPSVELNRLTLFGYGGTRLSNWFGDGSLFNLTFLKISDCLHCLLLPPLGQLPSLIELHLDGLASIRRVGSEFYGNGSSSVKPFQKLTILKFESMPEWEEWSSFDCGDNDDFPKLETLWIQNCPKLCGNIPKLLSSLRDLRISTCGEITATIRGDATPLILKGCESIVFENMGSLNSVISLEMGDLESNSFPYGMMENCTNLEVLRINKWFSLRHFPDDGLPTVLKELYISSCNNLAQFLPKETFRNYKHLEELVLQNCCDSLISLQLGLFPGLKFLCISALKNLESFTIEDEDHENLKSLRGLDIHRCDKLINFPSGGLPTPNLNSLHIYQCTNLKSLPEQMNTQLTSLQYLIIGECEEVESFGCLPSSLRYLCITECKKLMEKRREWNLQILASLDILSIGSVPYGLTSGYIEEIGSIPDEELQLPTSITRLTISRLMNLKTIDVSRLPNLQMLQMWDCPKVKFNSKLRNAQYGSILKLTINKCPLMAKQVKSRSSAFIADLTINNNCFEHWCL